MRETTTRETTMRETQRVGAGFGAVTAILACVMVALSGGTDTTDALPLWVGSAIALGVVARYVACTAHGWVARPAPAGRANAGE
ncbi:MAG: hypothetical protein JKY37_31985 [Nannocystaceae bacterium]|nr:hypothetical protein [Nannocystaceae bacterium]